MVDENVKRKGILEFDSDDPYKKYILDNPQDDPIIDQINRDFAMKDFYGKKAYMADKRAEMGEEEWGRILGEDDITRYAETQKGNLYDMFQATGADANDWINFSYFPELFEKENPFNKLTEDQLIDFKKAENAYEKQQDLYGQRWDPESYPLKNPRADKRGNIIPREGDLWDAVKGGGYDIWRDLYNMGTFGTAATLDLIPFMNQTGAPAWLYDKMYQSHDDIFEHEADDMWMTEVGKSLGNELFVPSSVDKDNPYYDASQAWRIGGDAALGGLLAYLTKGRGIFGATNLLPKTFPYLSGKGTFWPPRNLMVVGTKEALKNQVRLEILEF